MKETDSKVYTGKDEISLVEPIFIRMVARALMFGNTKHNRNSWKYCTDISLYKDAAGRHLLDYFEGKYYDDGDKGSGLPHLAHVGANVMILLWLEEHKRKELLNRTDWMKSIPKDYERRIDSAGRVETYIDDKPMYQWLIDKTKEMQRKEIQDVKKNKLSRRQSRKIIRQLNRIKKEPTYMDRKRSGLLREDVGDETEKIKAMADQLKSAAETADEKGRS